MQFDEKQIEAIENAASRPFSLITGGAGTGKTTIITELVKRLKAFGETPRLCAFAGKAAARLTQVTGDPASTIHRLLGYNGNRFMFGKLDAYSIVVDESSMISSDLMAEIVRRNPKRLVLVGDVAQLPPVGKGQPFHDLVGLRPDIVTRLERCYRNSEAVYHAAMQIRNGETPTDRARSENEQWDVFATGGEKTTHRQILDFVRGGHLDFDRDIILVPRNGDNDEQPCTVKSLNRDIIEIVNPRESDQKWQIGDRVINTKNNPDMDIWNGTTGTVTAVDHDGGVWLKPDTPVLDTKRSKTGSMIYTDRVLLGKEERKHLQHAYALTVHKSQGSQYRRVIFVCLQRDSFMLLDRSLIYTAVTRTQEKCVVVGQWHALTDGISKVSEKRTVIQELMKR